MTTGSDDNAVRVASLVDRARDGDDDAFESLVDLYKDKIYSYVSRMARDPIDPDDITQDAFIRAYQSLPNFRGGSSFQTWLYRIATNLVIDAARRQKRRHAGNVSLDAPINTDGDEVRMQIPDDTRGPGEVAESRAVTHEVRTAIAELSPKLRSVLVMYDLQGLSYREIAQILGCPLGTVKSRLFNARAQLKEMLEREEVL